MLAFTAQREEWWDLRVIELETGNERTRGGGQRGSLGAGVEPRRRSLIAAIQVE